MREVDVRRGVAAAAHGEGLAPTPSSAAARRIGRRIARGVGSGGAALAVRARRAEGHYSVDWICESVRAAIRGGSEREEQARR